MNAFVPGLELAERFFREAVTPILRQHMPELRYSAGLIGPGSEVLGFDDAMSTDHHWGPRAMLFLQEDVLAVHGAEIRDVLAQRLPYSFMGYPTHWSAPDPNDKGVQKPQPLESGPVNHRVELFTLHGFFRGYLGLDVQEPLSPADRLMMPWQKLRSIVAGKVFHDDLGLEGIRDRLRW